MLSGSLTPMSLPPSAPEEGWILPWCKSTWSCCQEPSWQLRQAQGWFHWQQQVPVTNVGTHPRRGQPQEHLVWPREPTGRAQHPPAVYPPQSSPACTASGTAAAPRLDAALPGTGTQGMRAQPWALPPPHAIPGTSCHSCSVLDKRCHTPATNQPCSARE